MDKGCTNLILSPFIHGMVEAGSDIEIFYTQKLSINPCQADLSCWHNNIGECILKDDMQKLLPKLEEAEIWVLATPVYFNGVTGPMKNLMDRLLPLGVPVTNLKNGHSNHPSRRIIPGSKVVLVSSCGLYEKDNFNATVYHIKAFCKNVDREFAGALIRPHAWVVNKMPNDIITAAKEAGRQLIKEGKMSKEHLNLISREMISLEKFLEL
jgi:multimeric flavodoxin WrbA